MWVQMIRVTGRPPKGPASASDQALIDTPVFSPVSMITQLLAIRHGIDVDVIQLERQRQAHPQDARRNLCHRPRNGNLQNRIVRAASFTSRFVFLGAVGQVRLQSQLTNSMPDVVATSTHALTPNQ